MKNFIKIFAVGVIGISFVNASAFQIQEKGIPLKGAPSAMTVKEIKNDGNSSVDFPVWIPSEKVQKKLRKADEKTYEVKCTFKYDPSQYRPSDVSAYNVAEGENEYYNWENDYVYLYLPAGTYDFRATYYRASETSMFGDEGIAYLILEDIDINSDTEVELDASLITEEIRFETYNPDGEKSRFRYLRYLNENWDYEIIEEYNVYDMYCTNFFKHKYYGTFKSHSNCGGLEVEPGPCGELKTEWYTTIFINHVSDKYEISQLRMLYKEDECWIVPMFADGSTSQLVTNKGENYSELTDIKFEKSPQGKNSDIVSDQPYGFFWGMNNEFGPGWSTSGVSSSSDAFHHFRYCETSSSRAHPEYICYAWFTGDDSVSTDTWSWEDEEGNVYEQVYYNSNTITSPRMVLGMNNNFFYPDCNNRFLSAIEGGRDSNNLFPVELGFEKIAGSTLIFNSSPQFIRFYYLDYITTFYTYPYPMISYDSCGFNGETRDFTEGDISIIINGETVCKSIEELDEWAYGCTEKPMDKGDVVFSYSNDNIEVDGIKGLNTATVRFNTSLEDALPPFIQMVQFKTNLGDVTERFDSAEDGNLFITGADFLENRGIMGENDWSQPLWYTFIPCYLTTEYSPYGSNDFHSLEMTDTNIAVFGFGNIYSANLENVIEKSSTGWFDLRIKMMDNAGNYNEQLISPAFKINKNTGIQSNNINKANLRVENGKVVCDTSNMVTVYNLSGHQVENVNLAPGIYIAKSGESICKLRVR